VLGQLAKALRVSPLTRSTARSSRCRCAWCDRGSASSARTPDGSVRTIPDSLGKGRTPAIAAAPECPARPAISRTKAQRLRCQMALRPRSIKTTGETERDPPAAGSHPRADTMPDLIPDSFRAKRKMKRPSGSYVGAQIAPPKSGAVLVPSSAGLQIFNFVPSGLSSKPLNATIRASNVCIGKSS
jgi:hypothetical protein